MSKYYKVLNATDRAVYKTGLNVAHQMLQTKAETRTSVKHDPTDISAQYLRIGPLGVGQIGWQPGDEKHSSVTHFSHEGGISYIKVEHIFSLIDEKVFIREASLPTDALSQYPKTNMIVLGEEEDFTAINVIERLVNEGAKIEQDKHRLFRWAIGVKRFDVLTKLVEWYKSIPVDVMALALSLGDKQVVSFLKPHAEDDSSGHLLCWCIRENHLDFAKYLISQVKADFYPDTNGALLSFMIEQKQNGFVKFLLNREKEYSTATLAKAFIVAVEQKNLAVVHDMTTWGQPSQIDTYFSELCKTSYISNKNVFDALMAKRPKINFTAGQEAGQPLANAVKSKHRDTISMLLRLGAKVDISHFQSPWGDITDLLKTKATLGQKWDLYWWAFLKMGDSGAYLIVLLMWFLGVFVPIGYITSGCIAMSNLPWVVALAIAVVVLTIFWPYISV